MFSRFLILIGFFGFSSISYADSIAVQQLGESAHANHKSAADEAAAVTADKQAGDHQQDMLSDPTVNGYAQMKNITTDTDISAMSRAGNNEIPSEEALAVQANGANLLARETHNNALAPAPDKKKNNRTVQNEQMLDENLLKEDLK